MKQKHRLNHHTKTYHTCMRCSLALPVSFQGNQQASRGFFCCCYCQWRMTQASDSSPVVRPLSANFASALLQRYKGWSDTLVPSGPQDRNADTCLSAVGARRESTGFLLRTLGSATETSEIPTGNKIWQQVFPPSCFF